VKRVSVFSEAFIALMESTTAPQVAFTLPVDQTIATHHRSTFACGNRDRVSTNLIIAVIHVTNCSFT
jgi:hypothetical protein